MGSTWPACAMRLACWIAVASCGRSPGPAPSPEPGAASGAPANAAAQVAPDAPVVVAPDAPAALRAIDPDAVAALWPDGCFTVREPGGRVVESSHARCAVPRRPYSTFKLANALIAVDAGLLEGPDAPMAWDRAAIPDEPRFLAAWRQPHTLRSGMAVSAVPHFRTLALRLGAERMRAGLAKLDYGNRDTSGGLDRFWLRGGLRISAEQQLAFVSALARGKLAVSARAQEVVREVSRLRVAGAAALHGKTGAGPIEDGNGGWLVWQVGWIERGGEVVPYACWMDVKTGDIDGARAARDARLRETLDVLGLFPKT